MDDCTINRPVDLTRIRHVALDMDGTIYCGRELFDCTQPFLGLLDELDIGHTFLTNNCSRSVSDYVAHLREMGIRADREQVHTSGAATIDYLRVERPELTRPYVLGTCSLHEEFSAAGFDVAVGAPGDEPDVVVVSIDTSLTYDRLCSAAYWISQGKPFVATHPDLICPTGEPTVIVDCGAICACLRLAAGRGPDMVLGKPNTGMLAGVLRRHGLAPSELAMVGDRTYTDVAMAAGAGAVGVLVLTGEATAADAAECDPAPDIVAPSLREFGRMLRESRPV